MQIGDEMEIPKGFTHPESTLRSAYLQHFIRKTSYNHLSFFQLQVSELARLRMSETLNFGENNPEG